MKRLAEKPLRTAADTLELEPFGVTNGIDRSRPVILLREKGGEAVLPVWLSPLEAGIAMSQSPNQVNPSPHEVSLEALKVLGVRLEECHFRELRGNQQYVDLKFAGSRRLRVLRMRADHVISFCLHAKARFFCTRGYLQKCRDVETDPAQWQVASGRQGGGKRAGNYYLN